MSISHSKFNSVVFVALFGLLYAGQNVAIADGRQLEAESAVVTKHSTTVRGKQFSYTATAGTQPVWDKNGKVIASHFYTYYKRDKIKSRKSRPLIISFNGGPGSASVWMHIAYTGPRILNAEDDKLSDKDKRARFFGVKADIEYLAEWYQKALDASLQKQDLAEILPGAEDFAVNELLPALVKGSFIEAAEKQRIAEKMAYYSGLSVQAVLQNNLDVPNQYFWKELLRDRSLTIGRLDSRYLGIYKKDAGDSPDYNAELTSWLHAFTPAINYYLREKLEYRTDIKYNMFGDVRPWDRENNQTGENLRLAMAANPYLKVMIQSGYFDGATNYFDAKYTMWQLDPSGRMKDRGVLKRIAAAT